MFFKKIQNHRLPGYWLLNIQQPLGREEKEASDSSSDDFGINLGYLGRHLRFIASQWTEMRASSLSFPYFSKNIKYESSLNMPFLILNEISFGLIKTLLIYCVDDGAISLHIWKVRGQPFNTYWCTCIERHDQP